MSFKAQGLVLGAGTVLAASERAGQRPCVHLEADATRLVALLSSAYARPIGAEAIGHIRRAAQKWNEGDGGLAHVHLALTRLDPLAQPHNDARRLFMADLLMEAGAQPGMILSALGRAGPIPDPANKFYNPGQPRVPAGNGRISGQWTRIVRYLLQSLSPAALEGLARLALRFPAATVFFGVLFIPTNKTSPEVEYPVPGHPGLRVGRLIGETGWRIIYNDDEGDEQTILQRPDGTLRDPKGQIVGRVLPNGHVAIDLAAVAPNHTDDKEPRYCPAPVKDKFGGGPGSIPRAYEDQVKHFVNPEAPTPSGMAVSLANLMKPGAIVTFDDCQHSTGMMVEAKGPTFTDILRKAVKSTFVDNVNKKLLDQGLSQIQAAGTREVRWYFADKDAADYVRDLFLRKGDGRERIEIEVLPYVGKRK